MEISCDRELVQYLILRHSNQATLGKLNIIPDLIALLLNIQTSCLRNNLEHFEIKDVDIVISECKPYTRCSLKLAVYCEVIHYKFYEKKLFLKCNH